jgi:PadR family transcriptional regulator
MNVQEEIYKEGESDDTSPTLLGSLELLVLLAVLDAGPDAYGVSIQKAAKERGRRSISLGAVYTTLYRLEKKGIVRSRPGDPTPQRGGRGKRLFEITRNGQAAVEESLRTLHRPTGDFRFAGGLD